MSTTAVAVSRKHVELSLELKRKLIQEHEHGVPFTLLGKKYHIATSTAANIWRKKDFFLRSRMSGSRKRCNDRSKYKIVNQVTALFVKSMLERNHKIDGEVIKRFARTAATQCNFKDFHGSNGWLDSFKKRENVCWVRRRGERSAAAAAGAVVAVAAAAGVRRSDSPNLGAAAAAAALAATTANQQQHLHSHRHTCSPHSPSTTSSSSAYHCCCWNDTATAVVAATGGEGGNDDTIANEHHNHHHRCVRCNVAAAAAAVAALNSSDSIHERDHEIEDWFHGIPFLCQFFEEYQSMRQEEQSQAAAVAAAAAASGSGGAVSGQVSAVSAQLGAGGCVSNTNSSPSSGCGVGMVISVATSNSSSTSPSCSLSGPPTQSTHQAAQGQQQQSSSSSLALALSGQASVNNGQMTPSRSLSDACNLMATTLTSSTNSALPFSRQSQSSISLADIQSLRVHANQQSHQTNQLQRTMSTEMLSSRTVKAENQQQQQQYSEMATYNNETNNKVSTNSTNSNNFQQQQQQADFSQLAHPNTNTSNNNNIASNQSNNNEQLMDINFTTSVDDAPGQQQQQLNNGALGTMRRNESCASHHQMEMQQQQQQAFCQLDCSRTNSNHSETSGQCSGGVAATTVSSDYNSDDQEFYLSTTARYIPQDTQSDDLLYHDEVSDHNDCCSDHYEHQTGAGSGNAGGGNSGHNCVELQLHDYQSDIVVVGNGGSNSGGNCYMDEYEHISTIRHYPVPMPMNSSSSPATSATANGNGGNNSNGNASNNGAASQFNSLANSVISCSANGDDSFARAHQQLQQQQQHGFVSSSSCSPISNGHQHEQQQLLAADFRNNITAEEAAHYSALIGLHEHEQSIEHADHEEHNLLHNALMRSPEKLKLIDSIITLLNYASNYNQKMLAPLLEIKRCIERDLEVVLSDTFNSVANENNGNNTSGARQQQQQQQPQGQNNATLGVVTNMSKSCENLASGKLEEAL